MSVLTAATGTFKETQGLQPLFREPGSPGIGQILYRNGRIRNLGTLYEKSYIIWQHMEIMGLGFRV